MEILMGAPQATEDRLVSLAEVWNEVERVVSREKLSAAVATIASFVPETDDDAAAACGAELVKRYRTVRHFLELLLEVIDFRAVEAGAPPEPLATQGDGWSLRGRPDLPKRVRGPIPRGCGEHGSPRIRRCLRARLSRCRSA